MKATQTIPIIMVSGRAELADVTRGFEVGADGYVTKPATRGALLGVIEQVLAGGG